MFLDQKSYPTVFDYEKVCSLYYRLHIELARTVVRNGRCSRAEWNSAFAQRVEVGRFRVGFG